MWLEGGSFRNRFSWLCEVVCDKFITVEDIFRLVWKVGGDGWGWSRSLFHWEEELVKECVSIFVNVHLQIELQIRGNGKVLRVGCILCKMFIKY